MTEQPDVPVEEEQDRRPKAECPLQTCNWWIYFPESGDLGELEPQLREHTESHSPEEFMNTIGMLQQALFEGHAAINQLESALRGAHFIMKAHGIVPPSPFEQAAEQQIAVPGGGLLLPDHVAREQAAQAGQGHVVGKAKHGDVVPGKGTLVGKKITDPMVLRDLKKGQAEHGE